MGKPRTKSALEQRFENEIDPSEKKPSVGFLFCLGFIITLGSFVFGYDLGEYGGLTVMQSFLEHFAPGQTEFDGNTKGLIVSLMQIGALCGSLFPVLLGMVEKIGRKKSLMFSTFWAIIGVILQLAATDVSLLLVGRFIVGVGIGISSMTVPILLSEYSLPQVRGAIGTLNQLMIVAGVAGGFWACYINTVAWAESQAAWKAVLLVQIVAALLLLIGMFFLPESPRWYASKGRSAEAKKALAFVRRLPEDSPYIRIEYEEVENGIANEAKIGAAAWSELLMPGIRNRVFIGFLLLAFQQFCGSNAVTYYSSSFYGLLGIKEVSTKLMLSGFYGIMKIFGAFPSMLWLDVWGRKVLLTGGAYIMTTFMVVLALLLLFVAGSNPTTAIATVAFHGKGALSVLGVACIWLYIFGYACSWGPVPWVYNSEIYPIRIRIRASGLATAINWGANIIVNYSVPVIMEVAPLVPFVTFAIICFAMGTISWIFLPETKGRSLEEMDKVFGVPGQKKGSSSA